jgi:acetyl esterase/lipase
MAALADCFVRIAIIIANAPLLFSPLFNPMTVVHHVAYGPEPWQTLDIYIPKNTENKKLDVVVFFYGGRWTYGNKEDYGFIANALTQKNFITVIPDYSKYPQVRFPTFVEDGAKALAWVEEHIGKYNGDEKRIDVIGHSAGAHIGALLTSDAHYLGHEGKTIHETIHRFVGLAGPYAFIPDDPDLEEIFKPPENYPNMQVPTFIDGTEPPMLLLWGDKDTDVGRFNLERLYGRIHERGGKVETHVYPGVDHIGIIAPFVWFDKTKQPIFDVIIKFLKE